MTEVKRYANRISDADLRGVLKGAKLNRRGQYVADCPFCGKEEHFYVSQSTQKWDCKKCKESGGIYKLLRQLNQLELLEGASVEWKEEITSVRNAARSQEQQTDIVLPTVRLPVGFRVGANSDYLSQRGVTAADVRRYGIGYTTLLSKFANYVIIPVYDDGVVRGFLGRFGSKKVPANKLRWRNSVGTNFAGLLYGYDEIVPDETETIILVEGVFDKIKVDKVLHLHEQPTIKCCATFGKSISDSQITKLVSKRVTSVILLYDFDAVREMKSYGLALQKYFQTAITYTEKKDIDECSDAEAAAVFERLQSPVEFNYNTIRKI